jgi:hypothetical protein
MRQLSARYLNLGCTLAILLGLTNTLPGQAKALVGLTPVPPATAKPTDFGPIMTAEPANGVRLFYCNFPWSVIEPMPGKFNPYIFAGLPVLRKMGFTPAVTISTIDNVQRTVPYDLMTVPFNSPKMKARWDACLRFVAKNQSFHGNARWLSLGNDVDVYLGRHPAEADGYVEFIESGHDIVKSVAPTQLVGVTTTHDGARDRAALVAKLQRKMDYVSMTYYPVDARFHVRPLTDLPGDFARMIGVAGSRQLFIQGFGCPADPRISSEDLQAAYVRGMFEQLAKYGDKVAGVNWFLLADFNDIAVNGMAQYYQQDSLEFKEYLGTLGLKRTDGTARKAWNVFRELARNWGAQAPAPVVSTPTAQPAAKPAGAAPAKPAGTAPARPAAQPMKPPARQPGH